MVKTVQLKTRAKRRVSLKAVMTKKMAKKKKIMTSL